MEPYDVGELSQAAAALAAGIINALVEEEILLDAKTGEHRRRDFGEMPIAQAGENDDVDH